MKKTILLSLLLAIFSQYIGAQNKIWDETEAQKTQRMKWWTDARFGMFIHFGLYAQAGRHEWVKSYEKMTDEQYKIVQDAMVKVRETTPETELSEGRIIELICADYLAG